jgi:hypothetical protein
MVDNPELIDLYCIRLIINVILATGGTPMSHFFSNVLADTKIQKRATTTHFSGFNISKLRMVLYYSVY